nr:HNH endonuclease signature motif containing protein [Eremococcus coleocola]
MCEECKKHGRTTVATVVDHIVPHKGNKKLFWDSNNHQSLCESCHNRKTASKDMGGWRPEG